jgi:hypothetical protein
MSEYSFLNQFVIIRTRDAGVHTGFLAESSRDSMCVVLTEARRIWWWSGAFTLNEIAMNGCGDDSRISAPVDFIRLTQVLEVIPCREGAKENLRNTRNTTN